MNYLLIALMWTGYCILHSFLISTGLTSIMARLLKNYYAFYRLIYVVISLVLLIPLINFTHQSDSRVIITYPLSLNIIRYVLSIVSLLTGSWVFLFNYDPLRFIGIRQILNFNKTKERNSSKELNKKGILGIIRHPMYLALIVLLWCHTFKISDIVVNTILTIYLIIGTKLEERKLILEFGNAYIQYQKEVPMLVPFTKLKVKKLSKQV